MFTEEELNSKSFHRTPLVRGNWNCAKCFKEITELPFVPDPQRKVLCKECQREKLEKSRKY